uniref:Zinc finger protein 664 n=1 Tax=Nothobranchius korthausae TaxID=1143690 RepID=A0A1A8GB51_9TELE
MQQKSDLTAAEETFYSQAELIMEIAVESAVSVLQRSDLPLTQAAGGGNSQAQLTAVLAVMSKEAVRKVCSVFRELYMSVVMENKALKEKVRLLECGKPQSPKTHAAVCSSAPFPVTLTQQPITSQSRPSIQELQEGDAPDTVSIQADEVLEITQFCKDMEINLPSLPVSNDQPTRGPPSEGNQPAANLKEEHLQGSEPNVEPEGSTVPESEAALSEEAQKEEKRRRKRELYKEKRFFCELCSQGFHQRYQLLKHMPRHGKPFHCSYCEKGFYEKQSFDRHQLSHQLKEAQERDPDKLLSCDQCSQKFKLPSQLRVHKTFHKLEKCPLKCHACDRTFTSTAALRCDQCGEGFSGTWALKTHMLVHGVEKPFMCDLCGKMFFYNCQLQKHQQLVHGAADRRQSGAEVGRRKATGIKPFSCKTCMKSFSSSSTLRSHEKSHAQNKEFTCSTCGKAFHLQRLFLYHQRQHTGDRPHVCTVCDKGFLLASQLKQHELLHTGVKPHRCSQCSKEFRTPQNYHRHLLVHSGEKPYQCTVCSRRFRQSNQLKSHMQIHTGIKLYSCQRCQQGFSDSRQLKKHRCGEDSQDSIQSTVEQNQQRDVLTWTPDFSS